MCEYSFELMRDDVLGVLDQLGLHRISLIGQSMGGTVAYLIAEQAPHRTDRLILEDTPPPAPQTAPHPGGPKDRCRSTGRSCRPLLPG